MKKVILFGLLFSFLFSCSTVHIEKRRYRKGFHISLNKHNSNVQEKPALEHKANVETTDEVIEVEQLTSDKVVMSTKAISNSKKCFQPIKKLVKQKLKSFKQKEVKYTNSAVFKRKTQSSSHGVKSKKIREKVSSKPESNAFESSKDEGKEDKHIRSPFARVLLTFLNIFGTLGLGLLVLSASFIIAWNASTIAGAILSLAILAIGIYLLLFLSSLAFLNIFRRESEIGVSMSKKAAGRAFLIFAVICLLLALRIFIPFML
jgi:cation transport ATPase